MTKPDFILIGASKAGTSTICSMLEQHPNVSFLKPREPNFFSVHYEKGWEWYEKRFPANGGDPGVLVGEKSPTYSNIDAFPEVCDRIAADLPNTKILYVVRDPFIRIESRWIQAAAAGDPRLSLKFNEDILQNLPNIISTTDYRKQLIPYRRNFREAQIRVIFFEDFVADSAAKTAEILSFIGVPDPHRTDLVPEHKNPSVGKTQDGMALRLMRSALPRDTRRLRIPKSVRRMARRTLKQQIEGRPEWEPATRAAVVERIGPSIRTFLSENGKAPDFWNLSAND